MITSRELAGLEHENWIAYLTGVASCNARTTVARNGGVLTLLTGLPMDWFNQILIEGEHATPASAPSSPPCGPASAQLVSRA